MSTAFTHDQLIDASHTLFGLHPVDAIGRVEWGANTLMEIAEILRVIHGLSQPTPGGKETAPLIAIRRIRRLASAAKYIADDMANTLDCEHEQQRSKLIEAGIVGGAE